MYAREELGGMTVVPQTFQEPSFTIIKTYIIYSIRKQKVMNFVREGIRRILLRGQT